ncbi:MAG: hypothetical protein GF347_03360 [Candidatus Moranbacteria bacterium]|nr:hypothetical protein [Candidatus Moranbacteria bacterium]
MDLQERIKRMNKILALYPIEELHARADEHNKKELCFHWLLWEAKGLKKGHFPLLFTQKGYHQTIAYLRWIANSEKYDTYRFRKRRTI